MNWYSIFYWISVADKVSKMLGSIAILTFVLLIICAIGWFVSTNAVSESANRGNETDQSVSYNEWMVWLRSWRLCSVLCLIICVITSIMWAGLPSKKDALIIVAGGAVGQFITTDSSAKQIPAEAMNLLRTKIRSEIMELNNPVAALTDTLQEKSKEELIELLKNKK